MNEIYSFLILLFCFSNLLAIEQLNPSSYSLLIDSIRMDLVDKVLINLPKKEVLNFLQMLKEMEKTKKSYNLTDAESAYLVYKWIAQNIKLTDYENDYAQKVYDSGEGNELGISRLFIQMCNYYKVESNFISGSVKIMEGNSSDVTPHTWNYIVIDDLNYLVDPTIGIQAYNLEGQFGKLIFDFFFSTKPEILIYNYFPDDIKYQLLPQPITFEKFNSLPFTTIYFYLFGFTNFYPDYFEIKSNQEIKIQLTYDQLIGNIDLVTFLNDDPYFDYSDYSGYVNKKIVNSNGKISITFNESHSKVLYLSILLKDKELGEIPLIAYKFIP